MSLKDKMRGLLLQRPAHRGKPIPDRLLRYLPRTDPRYIEWEGESSALIMMAYPNTVIC